MLSDNINRFTKTVENYIKYRPSYPAEIYSFLIQQGDLTSEKVIADIGSGTGFLSKLFLDHGHTVYGVEPNRAMRNAGEQYLSHYQKFHSVDGSAEATTLDSESVDRVTAGTAFHWFDPEKSKIEFKRILKSLGFVLLIWNVRNKQKSALLRDYESLLMTDCKEYKNSPAQKFNQSVAEEFFKPYSMKTASFPNKKQFDWEGFKGRLLSTSYSLRETDSQYEKMLKDLREIFERHQKQGVVEFLYDTKLYYGQMK